MGRHVAGKGEIVKACNLVRKPDGKTFFGQRRENNIKMDFT
jgi:hypothetical protein